MNCLLLGENSKEQLNLHPEKRNTIIIKIIFFILRKSLHLFHKRRILSRRTETFLLPIILLMETYRGEISFPLRASKTIFIARSTV